MTARLSQIGVTFMGTFMVGLREHLQPRSLCESERDLKDTATTTDEDRAVSTNKFKSFASIGTANAIGEVVAADVTRSGQAIHDKLAQSAPLSICCTRGR